MSDQIGACHRLYRGVENGQPFAKLENPAGTFEWFRFRLAQEVDVEAGGDGKRDRTDMRDERDIGRHVRQREERRARDRAARTDVALFGSSRIVAKPGPVSVTEKTFPSVWTCGKSVSESG